MGLWVCWRGWGGGRGCRVGEEERDCGLPDALFCGFLRWRCDSSGRWNVHIHTCMSGVRFSRGTYENT